MLSEIQKQLKAPKNQKNNFGNYNYRTAEGIIEAVKPLLPPDVSLVLSDDVIGVCGSAYIKSTAALYKGGELMFSADAFAREPKEKKKFDDSQLTGSSSSYARKYALCGLFAIDSGDDPDVKNTSAEYTSMSKPLNAARRDINEQTPLDKWEKKNWQSWAKALMESLAEQKTDGGLTDVMEENDDKIKACPSEDMNKSLQNFYEQCRKQLGAI